jgi:hypothetical protein
MVAVGWPRSAETRNARNLAAARDNGHNGGLVARLLNRFGRRLCVLEHLNIEYPVGRAGSKFEALLPTRLLGSVDLMALRHFVVLDDSGNRYPAVIEHVSESNDDEADFVAIRGVVVTNMS